MPDVCSAFLNATKEIQYTCSDGVKKADMTNAKNRNRRQLLVIGNDNKVSTISLYPASCDDSVTEYNRESPTFVARILFESGLVTKVFTDGAERSAHADFARSEMRRIAAAVEKHVAFSNSTKTYERETQRAADEKSRKLNSPEHSKQVEDSWKTSGTPENK
jgi:hypothetical protein